MTAKIALLVIYLSATSSLAEVVVDQQYSAPLSVGERLEFPDELMAQTFTTQHSGELVGIGLQVFIDGHLNSRIGVTDGVHLRLTRTDVAGNPDLNAVLATWVIDPLIIPLLTLDVPTTSTDLTAFNLYVNAGDQLAIVMNTSYVGSTHPEVRNYEWLLSPTGDVIPGGKFLTYSPEGFGPRWFSTWDPPNPTNTGDGGFQVLINVAPEPSTTNLLALAAVISCFRGRKNVHRLM